MQCRICGYAEGRFVLAAEMMFGTKEQFAYFECGSCGCIQIEHYPVSLERFYRDDYFAYKDAVAEHVSSTKLFFIKKWSDYGLTGRGFIGRIVSLFQPVPPLYTTLRRYGLNRTSRFLDIGCGTGGFLRILQRGGFIRLVGIDPYLKENIIVSEHLVLKKMDLFSLHDVFDYISFNHSLEHMPNQHDVLKKARGLLSPNGIISISTPVSGYAWRTYGANWVQLDAPRHFYIHSRQSMQVLAQTAGLEIAEIVYNSNEFQLWGSEQYAQGIPLMHEKSYWNNKDESLFPSGEIERFRKMSEELNIEADGDQATFILKHNA